MGKLLLRSVASEYRSGLILAALIASLAALPMLLSPHFIGDAVDAIKSKSKGSLTDSAEVLTLVAVAGALLAAVRMVAVSRVGYRIESKMRERYFSHLTELDLHTLEAADPGQMVTRGTSDLRAVRMFLSSGLASAAQSVVTLVFVITALLIHQAVLAVIAVAMAVGIVWLARRQARVGTELQRQGRQCLGELADEAEEGISGITVIRAFGRRKQRIDQYEKTLQESSATIRKVTWRNAKYRTLISLLPYLGLIALLAFGSALAIEADDFTDGEFVTLYMYFLLMAGPASTIANVVTLAQDATAASRRIEEILEQDSTFSQYGRDALPAGQGAINLSKVSGSHRDGSEMVSGLDLGLKGGQTTALVGPDGAGKSTALALAKRLYPLSSGEIEIDGYSGTEIDNESLQREVSMVSSDEFLTAGTIREIITYGVPDATDEQILQAAKIAKADSFIKRLPEGYDTDVGENGARLSGGQRQRLALARSLLLNPRTLLLDGATSGLDLPTESAVTRGLKQRGPDRTTLIVTDRPQVLSQMDSVMVMDSGSVVAEGSHGQLLKDNDIYQQLIDSDAEAGEDSAVEDGQLSQHESDADSTSISSKKEEQKEELPSALPLKRRLAVLGGLIRPDRKWLLLAVAAVLVATAAALVPAYLAGQIINDVLGSKSLELLEELLTLLVLTVLLWTIASFGRYFLIPWIGQRAMMRLRMRVFKHLLDLNLTYFSSSSAGRILSRLTYNIETLTTVMQNGANMLISAVLMLIGTSVMLFVLDPLLALIAYATVPFILLASLAMSRARRRINNRAVAGVTALTQHILETVKGARVMRSFAREKAHQEEFAEYNRLERKALRQSAYLFGTFSLTAELIVGIGVAVMVLVGGRQAIDGAVTIGVMVALTTYLRTALTPVSALVSFQALFGQVGPSFDRIIKILDIKPDPRPVISKAGHLEAVKGEVEFKSAYFAYDNSGWALKDISFSLGAGESVAVVGESGAGKSTMIKLLLGFSTVQRGEVLLDGRSVAELDDSTLRSNIGFVPQESFVFKGTVFENIAFADPTVSRDRVEGLISELGADSLLKLPNGLDTEVSSGGRGVSITQRQLVAICRAILAKPKVLVMDEATSGLDLATKRKIAQAIDQLLPNCTKITIAHQLELCKKMDRILVLKDSRLVENGTHSELLDAGGEYARLWGAK